jgi:hypothetical protein
MACHSKVNTSVTVKMSRGKLKCNSPTCKSLEVSIVHIRHKIQCSSRIVFILSACVFVRA